MRRKSFLQQISLLTAGALLSEDIFASDKNHLSNFSRHLKPVGRALELEDYYVWCNSPIEAPDGKIHVFFSRWKAEKKMGGWINGSEIVHAIAATPESVFEIKETVLAPRGAGYWDATTCHNPSVKFVDNKYYLFFMGNSNGKTNTKRIGLAVADSLDGPWTRPDKPLLEPGETGSWDDHCTTNPAFVKNPNGKYWLYYKSWNTHDYETDTGPIKGNRKYGLAIGDKIEGPYIKYNGNPVIDFSGKGNNTQLEDAFVWMQKRKFNMLARDMGVFDHESGIIMHSKNGIKWSEPEIAYHGADKYIQQPPAPGYLTKYGRFERPQLLFQKGKPTYLFTASQGGKYMTASSFIFKID